MQQFKLFPWTAGTYTSALSSPSVAEGNCMLGETMILTPLGEKRIDELKTGDQVVTGDNRIVKIKSVQKYVNKNRNWRPYLLPKGTFEGKLPNRDLYISKFHAYKIYGEWRHVECNKNFKYSKKHNEEYEVTYYNLELPDFHKDTFIANGLEVECWDGVKIFEGKCLRNYKWVCEKDKCYKKLN